MKEVLITGEAGLTGSYLAEEKLIDIDPYLLWAGYPV